MNQILYQKSKKKLLFLRFQFIISIFFCVSLLLYIVFHLYSIKNMENFSSFLINNYNIMQLYNNNYINKKNANNSLIIGIIEIDKLKIKYPILSYTNDDLLKISPCRFYGPLPNKIGNLCIAGHNYDNNLFFSKLNLLDINDTIKIYDTNNNYIYYYIYDKFEIDKSDMSCTSQNTNGKREITLITCNNLNKNRLIIKAKE